MTTVRLTGLGVHPVKSTAIRAVQEARMLPAGLEGDRSWMVVDEQGDLVSARELHPLFTLIADTPATDPQVTTALRLRAPGLPTLDLDAPDTALIDVTVHGKALQARPIAGTGEWLEQATGRAGLRLVWCDDPTRRVLNPEYAEPGDHTAFADGNPVTLASLASLRRLNDWIAEGAAERGEVAPDPLPIQRFRPNLVVDGAEPFAEDDWTRIRIGEVVLRKVKLVDRCVMTTLSRASLETGPEPIRTLARHRRWDGRTWFAVHLVPEGIGTIRVGDVVEVD